MGRICLDCGVDLQRTGVRGRWPERCPACRARRKKELDRTGYLARYVRRGQRDGVCRDCGVAVPFDPSTMQRTPRSCAACRVERERARDRRRYQLLQRKAQSLNRQGRYRVRQVGEVVAEMTAEEMAALLAGATACAICGARFSDTVRPQVDHIIPIRIGGQHTAANVRVLCTPCNAARPKDGRDVLAAAT